MSACVSREREKIHGFIPSHKPLTKTFKSLCLNFCAVSKKSFLFAWKVIKRRFSYV